jgi:molybdopterin-guanine dinucleotide biosynthesis protein B
MRMMIVSVSGTSGSGKTTLIEKIITELIKRGVSVASVKHVHGNDVLVPEGKDTSRHLRSGSSPVIGLSSNEMVLYLSGERDLDFAIDLLNRLSSPEVIIVEGFKHSMLPKIVVGDAVVEGQVILRCKRRSNCSQRAANLIEHEVKVERALRSLPGLDCQKCEWSSCRDLAEAVADGVAKKSECVNMSDGRTSIIVDGEHVPLGIFVSDLVASTVTGLVKSLKEVGEPNDIEIHVHSKSRPSGEDR